MEVKFSKTYDETYPVYVPKTQRAKIVDVTYGDYAPGHLEKDQNVPGGWFFVADFDDAIGKQLKDNKSEEQIDEGIIWFGGRLQTIKVRVRNWIYGM